MKQLFIIILAVCLVIVSGCSSKNNLNESSVSESAGYTETRQEETDTSQTETSTAGQSPTTTEGSEDTTTKESVSTETKPPDTESKAENDKKEPQQTVSQPTTETETNSKETESSAEKPKETGSTGKTENTTSSEPTQTTEPVIPKATAADAKAIAAKTVEYINAYRAEQGVSAATVLPGLTEYAEYRSRQLVSNFAHDTADERAAATALEYGKYIDPVLYGATGEPYYTANAREAIVKAGYSGSIDTVAKNIAQLTRNSSGHWSYVGDEKYSYIAIGITYDSGYWYCDIAMARENTYN